MSAIEKDKTGRRSVADSEETVTPATERVHPRTEKIENTDLSEATAPEKPRPFWVMNTAAGRLFLMGMMAFVGIGGYSIGSYSSSKNSTETEARKKITKLFPDKNTGRLGLELNDENFQLTKIGLLSGKYEVDRNDDYLNIYARRDNPNRDPKSPIQNGDLLISLKLIIVSNDGSENIAIAKLSSWHKSLIVAGEFSKKDGLVLIDLDKLEKQDSSNSNLSNSNKK